MPTTAQSDVGALELVVLEHPRDAWHDQETVDAQWADLNYTQRPDFARAIGEHDQLADCLREAGAEVVLVPPGEGTGLDSIYVRDASVVTDRGVILCRMGKEARRHEPSAQRPTIEALGLSVIGEIETPGTLEGGDVVWLDSTTLAVGHGYRTNADGIRQLRALLSKNIALMIVPLPHFRGPTDVFHLMSIISPIDDDLALVYSPLMPVPFRDELLDRGYELVETPREELDSLGGNCLALGPRRCLLTAGNPITRSRLEVAGAEVIEFLAEEISKKGCGGPTCLTRPIRRRVQSDAR